MGLKLQMVSVLLENSAFVCLLVAVTTRRWASREDSEVSEYEGLFTRCVYFRMERFEECTHVNTGKVPSGTYFLFSL